jgi:putative permease
MGPDLLWILGVYTVIQLIDGNLLAPLMLSGVVNLHPAAVIVALLVFGSIWGFWGIFFAIPLASLVHAVLNAWPRTG